MTSAIRRDAHGDPGGYVGAVSLQFLLHNYCASLFQKSIYAQFVLIV